MYADILGPQDWQRFTVGTASPHTCRLMSWRVAGFLEQRYQMTVKEDEVLCGRAYFTGRSITLHRPSADTKWDGEEALFLLTHLFGHAVQCARDRAPLSYLTERCGGKGALPSIREVVAFEREASKIGFSVLRELGFEEMKPWYTGYAAADLAGTLDFHQRGERRPTEAYVGAPSFSIGSVTLPKVSMKAHRRVVIL